MQGHSWRRPLLIRACSWMQVRSLRRPSPPFPHKTKIEKGYSVSACPPGVLMVGWCILVWREREGAMKLFGFHLHVASNDYGGFSHNMTSYDYQ